MIKVIEGNPRDVKGLRCDATVKFEHSEVEGIAVNSPQGDFTITIDERVEEGPVEIIIRSHSDSTYKGKLDKDGVFSS
jgi:hypothetical protein